MIDISNDIKRRIDNYITNIPEYDDDELDEDEIDYLLDLEFECFRESEQEYESNVSN